MMKRCGQMMCLCLAAAGVGCNQPQKMDMSAMKPPPRPAELDMLEPWVGQWASSGEMTMGGKTMRMTGTGTIAWDCDRRVLVERAEEDMGDMGKSSALILYSWNAKDKKFNTYYANSMGMASAGDMTYDERTKTFHMTGKGPNPMTGEMTRFDGYVSMPDNSTMDWRGKESGMWGNTLGEFKGTAKRK